MRRLVVGLGLIAILAGCSSGSGSAAPTTAAITVTPTAPRATVPTATVQQVASIVAQYRAQILGAGVKLGSCTALQTVQDTDDPLNVLTAKLDCQSGVLETSTPSSELARALAATKPPAEVAALTQQTRAAAQRVSRLGGTYSNCLTSAKANNDILACVINFEWDDALGTLTSKLAGWDAYI